MKTIVMAACSAAVLLACEDCGSGGTGVGPSGSASGGSTGSSGVSGGSGSSTGSSGASGGSGSTTGGSSGASGSSASSGGDDGGGPTADEVKAWALAYKAAHPGNNGKDWDIIGCCGGASRTQASLTADADAMRLRSLCGQGQLPVIPILAWEYGGGDHPWINPDASALVYCVYIPVSPGNDHWSYDPTADHVTADLYVKFPDQNPCSTKTGADQVMACLGDPTNIEILVDTASFLDGSAAGYSLANASTDLNLILPDGTKIPMYHGA